MSKIEKVYLHSIVNDNKEYVMAAKPTYSELEHKN